MLYIALEGYECSGKSTLIKKLFEHCEGDDRVVFVREPGTTKVAEQLRTIMLTNDGDISGLVEFMLVTTARIDLLNKIVNKALEENKIVISDRSVFSGMILQNLRSGLEISLMDKINSQVLTRVPNKVFTLEVSKEELTRRLNAREDLNSYDTLDHFDGFVKLQTAFVEGKLNGNIVKVEDREGNIVEEFNNTLSKASCYKKLPNNTLEEQEDNFKNIVEMIDCYRDW